MADNTTFPDYPMPETMELERPEQYRALFEDTRTQIVRHLSERAATTSELAAVLNKPKGTVGYHLKVLADAGLVKVVRTERVRALEAKYYGRTAKVFLYGPIAEALTQADRIIGTVSEELAHLPADRREEVNANLRYARIPAERAHEFSNRLNALLQDFADETRQGTTTYALAFALYPSVRSTLPQPDPDVTQ